MRVTALVLLALVLAGCGRLELESIAADHRSSWSDARRRVDVAAAGEVEFTDNDNDVQGLSEGGFLVVQESRWWREQRIDFHVGPGGVLQREYRVNGVRRELDEEGRRWVSEILPEVTRRTTIGARARAQRIARQHGPEGLLDEVPRAKSESVKQVLLEEFFEFARLEPPQLERAARVIAREIQSEWRRARLLIKAAPEYLEDGSARRAYFEAVKSIGSSGDRRRVLTEIVEREGRRWDAALPAFLDATESIGSDGDKRAVLVTLLERVVLDKEQLVLVAKAAESIGSAGDRRAVLVKLIEASPKGDQIPAAVVDATLSMGSDGDRRSVLIAMLDRKGLRAQGFEQVAKAVEAMGSPGHKRAVLVRALEAAPPEERVLAALITASATIGSDGDRRAVLVAALDRRDLPAAAVAQVVKASESVGSSGDRKAVLIRALESSPDPLVRAAVVSAAAGMGSEGDRRHVLSAVLDRGRVGKDALIQVVQAAGAMGSSGEKRHLLMKVLETAPAEDAVIQATLEAAGSIGSDGDRAHVLSAVMHKDGLSKESAVRAIRAAGGLHSDDHKARVLLELPPAQLRDRAVAEAYSEAAHSIRSGERYRQVMSVLYEKRGER